MTVADWLDARTPRPPSALARRVAAAVEELGPATDSTSEDRLFAAADALLGQLLRDGCGTRSAAQDLLAVDALVTYAFEAAAEHQPSRLDERAAAAMRRISALGAGGST